MQTAKLDIIAQIKHDIRETESYYTKLKSARDRDEKNRWFNLLIWELSRYMVAEEIVLFPIYAGFGEVGQGIATDCRRQHQNIKEMLVEQKVPKTAGTRDKLQSTERRELREKREHEREIDFEANVDYIMKTLAELFRREETLYLPFLEERLLPEEREKAGSKYANRKKIVPTRPHQGIPDRHPGLESAVSLLVSPIDKIRDMFRHFPKEHAPAG